MAADLDDPPIYDPLTKEDEDHMNDPWILWITTFFQTLSGYLSKYGMFIPNITTMQRDTIQSPQTGQLIYNSDTNSLQVWQIKAGVAVWRDVTTTP